MGTVTEYGSLREKIAAEKVAKIAEQARWAEALAAVAEEALAAGEAAVPAPMVVYEAEGLSDRPKPGGKAWFEAEGACGFAWVNIWPERGGETRRFVNWLTGRTKSKTPPVIEAKAGNYSYGSGGGFGIWCPMMTQSMARKEAWARAMADGLSEIVPGLKANAGSRMD